MEIVELQGRTEVAGKVLEVATMLAVDKLYTKKDAAEKLVEILKECEYIPKVPVQFKERFDGSNE